MLAKACDYTTTGTVEFLMDANKDFYFLEMNTRLQVEHPITEEITGVDLVEQQLLISAGHKLQFTQDDIAINGHSVEYRVYAEDPSRKFLPSIGFLRKYKEPNTEVANERVRIDTGVEEGSEISMFYDPMISKLITWGKDRDDAMRILDRTFDEYVIQGVTHNIGFGKSILANEGFAKGDYSTAFIPTYYPDGFSGDKLTSQDNRLLALTSYLNHNSEETRIVRLPDGDYKISHENGKYTITDLANGDSHEATVDSYSFTNNSLIRLSIDGQENLVHFHRRENDGMTSTYGLKGNLIKATIFDERQHELSTHMPEPVVIDSAKVVMSPMPGAIVDIFVQPGDKVVDGQQLCIIEAMKMQNIIKAEREGKVKSVNVKAGDSVAVDELIIEFE